MIKIVTISDTHGTKINNLPKADLLIHSGDWSYSGSRDDTEKFLVWLNSIKYKYKKIICVPGNHDIWVADNIELAIKLFKDNSIDILIDDYVIYNEHIIYGMPWSPKFGKWKFMTTDLNRKLKCDLIKEDTTILVTHAPPKNYLDQLAENGSSPGSHVGCEHIKDAIFRIKPKLHIFGHIHEGSGVCQIGNTIAVNAAYMDEYYQPINSYKVIYL